MRVIYDLDRFKRCGQAPLRGHAAAGDPRSTTRGRDRSPIQESASTYSDGFGREVENEDPGRAGRRPRRGDPILLECGDIAPGPLMLDENRKPVLGPANPRWVGKGRTVYNNKGKPVKQYEPFFSSTHSTNSSRDDRQTGVTPILFYDPVDRVVATLHPNHTYEKVVFDPWRQETWDVNDTVLLTDPTEDPDVGVFFSRLTENRLLAHMVRAAGHGGSGRRSKPPHQDRRPRQHAHDRVLRHPGPNLPHPAHNRYEKKQAGTTTVIDEKYPTRIELDIEGNQRGHRREPIPSP